MNKLYKMVYIVRVKNVNIYQNQLGHKLQDNRRGIQVQYSNWSTFLVITLSLPELVYAAYHKITVYVLILILIVCG